MAALEGHLVSESSYRSDEPVKVKFDLANREDHDLYVLTWYTPLEGLFSDCLKVLRDGERLPYDGVLAKRGLPTSQNYLLVPAGGEVTSVFDLSRAYEVSDSGNYEIALDTEIRDFFFASPSKSLEELIDERRQRFQSQLLQDGETFFIVVPGEGPRLLTKGQQARELSLPADEEEALTEDVGVREPKVIGGTGADHVQTRQAHFDGYDLCLGAMAVLTNDDRYQEWFGIHNDQRLQRVRDNFTKIKNEMESRTFTYAVNGPDCKINMHAYTHKGITQIWLCDPFWNSPAVGRDSKANTLLHEHSHASARTDDLIYSRDDCRLLATLDPDKAVMNASNYEYFAESIV